MNKMLSPSRPFEEILLLFLDKHKKIPEFID